MMQGSFLSSALTIKKDKISIERENRKIIDSKFEDIYDYKLTVSLTTDLGVSAILMCDKSLYILLL